MDYRPYVRQQAQAYGLDPNLAEALLGQESGGNPNALSPKGAYGLMQLMPATARELGVDPNIPEQNIDGGLRYLKQQIDRFGTAGGLAAYNAGPGRMSKTASFEDLPAETRAYVPSIMNKAALIAERGAVGQPSSSPQRPMAMDLNTLLGGYQKATQANDTEASAEIGGLIQQKYQGALAKAQAAGDQEAITEITQAMSSFGKPAAAPMAPVGQPAAAPVAVAPAVVPKAAPNPAAAISTEQPLGERINRGLSLGTRGVLQGVEKAFTYPVRAVGEAVSGALGLAGQAKAADYVSRTVGMKNPGAGALVSDIAGLATPQTKTEKVLNSGIEAASGLVTGTGVAKLAETATPAVKAALSVLMPGTSGTAGQVVKDAAIYGTLGSSMEAAPAETAAALAVLAAGKAGAGRYATSRGADKIIKNAGNPDAARLDAEIISDIAKTAKSGTQRGQPVTAVQLNAIEGKYINDVNAALKDVGSGKEVKAVKEALMNRRILTSDELAPLRATAAGDAAADAILKAQRARSLTAATQSSGGLMPLLREGVDLLPLPAFAQRGLKAAMGGRQTREVVAQRLAKQGDAAEKVLERLGPSSATESLNVLKDTAVKASKAKAAQAELAKQATAQKATDNAATKLQVLKESKRPLSGAFQELLPGGAANLNLSSKEAIDALRLTSRQFKDGPIGNAATEILRSGNVTNKDAFYGLQNQLRKLQEQGVLKGQPGALSEASSGVRNPISYKEAVRTAGEAADLARASAPTKELAQFATTVAGIKAPADKATAIAERLAKTSDPTEAAFLTQFVEPLAQFGKKTKK